MLDLQRMAGNAAVTPSLSNPGTNRALPLLKTQARANVQRQAGSVGVIAQLETDAERKAQTIKEQELEDKLDTISAGYTFLCIKQRDAVADLEKDAAKEDPPPLWQTLLVSMGQVALAGALGGVGGFVAAKTAAALTQSGATEFAARVIADAMKDASKRIASEGIGLTIAAISASTSDPRELFFRGQRDTLTDVSMKTALEFTEKQKSSIRAAKDPHVQADALLNGIKANYSVAYETQRNETLDSWADYLASNELGREGSGDKGGVDLSKQLGDTSAAGVLGLVIRAEGPQSRPRIERAEIEGLNEGLRGVIAGRPIRSIKMPLTVKGEVGKELSWGDKYISHKSLPEIRIGRNRANALWVSKHDSFALRWLYLRSNPPESMGTVPQSEVHEGAFVGAADLLDALGEQAVGDKLSG